MANLGILNTYQERVRIVCVIKSNLLSQFSLAYKMLILLNKVFLLNNSSKANKHGSEKNMCTNYFLFHYGCFLNATVERKNF